MKGGPMDLSYSYTPITTPVTVEAPPASDTLDVLELLKRMQHVPA
jgi:hypothetical protein